MKTTQRAEADGARLRIEQLDVLTRRELGRTISRFAYVRVVFSACLGLVGVGIVLFDPSSWQGWCMVVSGVVIGAVSIRDVRLIPSAAVTPAQVMYFAGTIFVMQATFIVATGGIRSPLVPVLVPMAIMVALAIGELRRYFVFATIPITTVVILVAIDVTGFIPPFPPLLLGGPEAVNMSPEWVLTLGGILVIAMIIGGLLGTTMRAALARAGSRATEAQRETLDTMGERNAELIELSGTLAHELKNPLASIQGLSSLLLRKQASGSREEEQMEVLLGEVHRMGGIVEEFLNFSRPARGLAVEDVCPNRLLREVARLYEALAAEQEVELVVEPEGHGHFLADPRKIKQVLVNLIQNAIDASLRGGRVTVQTSLSGEDMVRFTVLDEGSGLAPELRDRLFTVGATTKRGGNGLGLVIARSIAEQHGGSLVLEEREDAGVSAVFEVPLRQEV